MIKNFDTAETEKPARKFEMTEIAADCRNLLATAQQEAERVMAEARHAAEKIRDQAYRQGWETGRREATEKLEAEIRQSLNAQYGKRVENLVHVLEKLNADLVTQREPLLKATRDELVKLAMKIARMVIKKEVKAPGEVARLNLEKAIDLSARRTELVALVNESDMKTLQLVLGDLHQLAGPQGSVRLVVDPDIMPGGCLVRSVQGEVDATIETQLAEIERTLLGE